MFMREDNGPDDWDEMKQVLVQTYQRMLALRNTQEDFPGGVSTQEEVLGKLTGDRLGQLAALAEDQSARIQSLLARIGALESEITQLSSVNNPVTGYERLFINESVQFDAPPAIVTERKCVKRVYAEYRFENPFIPGERVHQKYKWIGVDRKKPTDIFGLSGPLSNLSGYFTETAVKALNYLEVPVKIYGGDYDGMQLGDQFLDGNTSGLTFLGIGYLRMNKQGAMPARAGVLKQSSGFGPDLVGPLVKAISRSVLAGTTLSFGLPTDAILATTDLLGLLQEEFPDTERTGQLAGDSLFEGFDGGLVSDESGWAYSMVSCFGGDNDAGNSAYATEIRNLGLFETPLKQDHTGWFAEGEERPIYLEGIPIRNHVKGVLSIPATNVVADGSVFPYESKTTATEQWHSTVSSRKLSFAETTAFCAGVDTINGDTVMVDNALNQQWNISFSTNIEAVGSVIVMGPTIQTERVIALEVDGPPVVWTHDATTIVDMVNAFF